MDPTVGIRRLRTWQRRRRLLALTLALRPAAQMRWPLRVLSCAESFHLSGYGTSLRRYFYCVCLSGNLCPFLYQYTGTRRNQVDQKTVLVFNGPMLLFLSRVFFFFFRHCLCYKVGRSRLSKGLYIDTIFIRGECPASLVLFVQEKGIFATLDPSCIYIWQAWTFHC